MCVFSCVVFMYTPPDIIYTYICMCVYFCMRACVNLCMYLIMCVLIVYMCIVTKKIIPNK